MNRKKELNIKQKLINKSIVNLKEEMDFSGTYTRQNVMSVWYASEK